MNILDKIVAQKRDEVARLSPEPVTVQRLQAALEDRGARRDFAAALRSARPGNLALIAEVKQASPSAGVIRAGFDPVRLAQEYEAAGANCISVLTDELFFRGSLHHLKLIRQAVSLPLLRKDFIIDARQIRESIQWGADAILLIVAILTETELEEFFRLATDAGLAVVVEVHDEVELDRAKAMGAPIIGINNRNLKTFQVDLATTERLAARLPQAGESQRPLLVAESGIHSRADVKRLIAAGAQAMLVGESLLKHRDIRAKVRELLGGS